MKPPPTTLKITPDVIERYEKPVPRYTSYPPAPYWSDSYGPADHSERLDASREDGGDLSLYFHIPFCIRRCFFCACNTRVTRDEALPPKYLRALAKETDAVVEHLGSGRRVSQVHLGGGTPTHLTPSQLGELMGMVRDRFDVMAGAEVSIEVHPTVTTTEHVSTLAELGFNRVSMGAQDFDEEVQRRINRHQTYDETSLLVSDFRDHGFLSINVDLVYGLPYQTLLGMEKTMEHVLKIRPDRLAVYSYAHLPHEFPHQRGFPAEVIPVGKAKLDLFITARNALIASGYEAVGFDHFCLSGDELWAAYLRHELQRNFMGYTTQAGKDLVALGMSAISDVQGGYAQNDKELENYLRMAGNGGLATARGRRLSGEDMARREAVMGFLCNGIFDAEKLRAAHGEASYSAIRDAENAASDLEEEGLIIVESGGRWIATELGRIFGRVVASTFDTYTRAAIERPTFSRGV